MMYKPAFNTVLVEIDSEADKWGKGNDEAMLGASYREGTVVEVGSYLARKDWPVEHDDLARLGADIAKLKGQRIMWNEGTEAGTTFEENGKMYGFIYWNDIRGVADEPASS